MLHAGLDLSRRKIDVCLMSGAGEVVDEWASPPALANQSGSCVPVREQRRALSEFWVLLAGEDGREWQAARGDRWGDHGGRGGQRACGDRGERGLHEGGG
jgi:hypothetical protein